MTDKRKVTSVVVTEKAVELNLTPTFIPATSVMLFSTLPQILVRAIPFYCNPLFLGMQVSNHIKDDCPLTIISCSYAGIGCDTKVRNLYNGPREMYVPYDLIFHRGLLRI